MRRVYANGRNPGDFEVPTGIVHRPVDPETGLILEDGCWPRWEQPTNEVFIDGATPESICPQSSGFFAWIGDALRGLNRSMDEQTRALDDVLQRADRVHPQARERLQRYIERNIREGISESAQDLRNAAEDWLRDFERQLEYEKMRARRRGGR
jgi:hypothetical protein